MVSNYDDAGQVTWARGAGIDVVRGHGRLAGPGTLDSTFSGDGKTTLAFNAGGTESASDVAVQSDGKTVVVGHVEINVPGFSTIRRFAVARFNVDGTPDTTFGQFHTGEEGASRGGHEHKRHFVRGFLRLIVPHPHRQAAAR